MSDPCKRCGDLDGEHDPGVDTPSARNCALYRIGTELAKANDNLEGIGKILHAFVWGNRQAPSPDFASLVLTCPHGAVWCGPCIIEKTAWFGAQHGR